MDKTMELIAAAAAGDTRAAEQLIEENSGLIWSIVRRFLNRGAEPEDLYQLGAIGLIKSVQKFDFSYNVRFSTYAVPMIMGEIKRFLRDDGIIKVSRSLKETAAKIKAISDEEAQKGGKSLTVSELAQRLNKSCEEITLAMEASKEVDSLQKTIYSDGGGSDGITLLERIGAKAKEDNEDKIVNSLMLKDIIDGLPPREQAIIRLRYFEDKTQSQTAQKLGISQVQVSRLEKKILLEMRKRMSE